MTAHVAPSSPPSAVPNTRWLKAALVGSIWAAVEIVLGSFLHNIRVPVTGTILASIGVSLLVASRLVWKENGIIWRAGVICAVLKSISPSAVIVGPMVGILSEAFLLEIATRLFGANLLGFLFGGALAVLTPLLQKVVSLLVTYGFNVAELYVRTYEYVARTMAIESVGPVDLLFIFMSLSITLGGGAGVMGMFLGRLALTIPPAELSERTGNSIRAAAEEHTEQRYRLSLLVVHGIALVGGMFAISQIHLWIASLYVLFYVIGILLLYPLASRRLRRPRLWIEFTAISLLAGFLLGGLNNDQPGWQWEGLALGFQMTLRGILVVTAFSAISVELRNPVILNWFLNRGLGQLSQSVEVAFEALPLMMNAFSNQKRLLLSPLRSLSSVLAAGKIWLEQNKLGTIVGPKVFLIAGPTSSGKTTLLGKVVTELRNNGIRVGGFTAPVTWSDQSRRGYDLVEIANADVHPLCRAETNPTGIRTGPFHFFPDAIQKGEAILLRDARSASQVLIIDEIGPLELDGKGWAQALQTVLRNYDGTIILTVRTQLIEKIRERWSLTPLSVWNVGAIEHTVIVETITSHLQSSR